MEGTTDANKPSVATVPPGTIRDNNIKPGSEEEKKESQESDGEPERTEPRIAPTLEKAKCDYKKILDGYLDYVEFPGDEVLRYPFRYRRLPWRIINELRLEAALQTDECPEMEERVYQELTMKKMIIDIMGEPWETFSETYLEGKFGEAMRMHLFRTSGINRIPQQMIKKLVEGLKPFIKDLVQQKKGRRKTL